MESLAPQRHKHTSVYKTSLSNPFDVSTAELVSSVKKQKHKHHIGSWTAFAKHPCGFIMKGSNNSHSNIKHKLHLKICEICKNNPIEDRREVVGSLSTPKVSFN